MNTTKARFWIIALVSAVAFGSILLIATMGAPAHARGESARPAQASTVQASSAQPSSVQASSVQARSYEGVITDTHCGAKHSAKINQTAGDCTQVCVHGGEHFALVDGDKMYVLEGEPTALKRAAGERVTVTGILNGDTISVTSVAAPPS